MDMSEDNVIVALEVVETDVTVAVVHPVEYYGIDVLDDDMFFYHEQFLRVLLPFLVQNYAFYFDYATFFLNFVRDL